MQNAPILTKLRGLHGDKMVKWSIVSIFADKTSQPIYETWVNYVRCINLNEYWKFKESILQPHATHQVAHKCEVCYGEEASQHVEPHTVQCSHVDNHKVQVDGTHTQDHQPSSYFIRPAEISRDTVSRIQNRRKWFNSGYVVIHLQSVGKVIH